MRFLSPSSRLVAASVAIALIFLAVLAGRSQTPLGRNLGQTAPSGAGAPLASPTESAAFTATPVTPGGSPETAPPTTPAATRKAIEPTVKPIACRPTDQDQYVYNPQRLQVAAACIRVTGTVAAIRREADGDLHILLNLDPPFAYLLRPANQGEELGDLAVEPVCVKSVTQLDAEALCAADPDSLTAPFPVIDEHVWMEGRYVFDLDHGGWAELHPLYRWGGA